MTHYLAAAANEKPAPRWGKSAWSGVSAKSGTRVTRFELPYAVRIASLLSLPVSAAWAAARRAIGTRYGEHDT